MSESQTSAHTNPAIPIFIASRLLQIFAEIENLTVHFHMISFDLFWVIFSSYHLNYYKFILYRLATTLITRHKMNISGRRMRGCVMIISEGSCQYTSPRRSSSGPRTRGRGNQSPDKWYTNTPMSGSRSIFRTSFIL